MKVSVGHPGGCVHWGGATTKQNKHGHGKLRVRGRDVVAHRFSYEHFIGPVHDGLRVLHKCDNPVCVNPDHLFLGTQKDNMVDKMLKGRAGSVITFEQAVKIKEVIASYNGAYGVNRRVAGEIGVSEAIISAVRKNNLWAHAPWPEGYVEPRAKHGSQREIRVAETIRTA